MLLSFHTHNDSVKKPACTNVMTMTARVIFGGETPQKIVDEVSRQAPQRLPVILAHVDFSTQVANIVLDLAQNDNARFERGKEVETAFETCFCNLFGCAHRTRIGFSTNKAIQLFLHNVIASVVAHFNKDVFECGGRGSSPSSSSSSSTRKQIHNAAQIVIDICEILKRWLPLDEENVLEWKGCHVLCFVLELVNPELFEHHLTDPLVVFLDYVFGIVVSLSQNTKSDATTTYYASSAFPAIDVQSPCQWIVYSPVWRKVRIQIGNLNALFRAVHEPPLSPQQRKSPLLRSM